MKVRPASSRSTGATPHNPPVSGGHACRKGPQQANGADKAGDKSGARTSESAAQRRQQRVSERTRNRKGRCAQSSGPTAPVGCLCGAAMRCVQVRYSSATYLNVLSVKRPLAEKSGGGARISRFQVAAALTMRAAGEEKFDVDYRKIAKFHDMRRRQAGLHA